MLVAAGSVKIRNTDRKWVVLPVDWANLSEMTFLVFAAEVGEEDYAKLWTGQGVGTVCHPFGKIIQVFVRHLLNCTLK